MMRRVLPLVLLVVVANAVMLARAASNRAVEPDAIVRMTERELMPAFESDRNSARELQLRTVDPYLRSPSPWLDAAKLASLGFDCSVSPSNEKAERFYGRLLARRAFGVFEYDGPAWQAHVDQLQREAARESEAASPRGFTLQTIDSQVRFGSRLVPVDAGPDPAILRRLHPDRTRYLILPVVVRVTLRVDGPNSSTRVLTGSVAPIVRTLVVPLHLRAALDRLAPISASAPADEPRYVATLAVGQRYEPWIVAIEPLTP